MGLTRVISPLSPHRLLKQNQTSWTQINWGGYISERLYPLKFCLQLITNGKLGLIREFLTSSFFILLFSKNVVYKMGDNIPFLHDISHVPDHCLRRDVFADAHVHPSSALMPCITSKEGVMGIVFMMSAEHAHRGR